MKQFLRILGFIGLMLAGAGLTAAERIPEVPKRYFNDYAGVVSPATAERLNARLEQFERESSNQLVVAIYPKMESDSSVADYTVRIAQAWHVGKKGRKNGVVLFAFMQEHKLYMQVGYGLEARLPDAIAKRIIEREIVPRFRAHDVDGGMTSAVEAMISAAKGEYRGSGKTQAESTGLDQPTVFGILFALGVFIIVVIVSIAREKRNPYVLMNPNRRGTTWVDFGGGSLGGWSGSSSGGGGDFSSGGGDFGGGGAGGDW